MPAFRTSSKISALAAALLFLSLFASFLAQDPQPSPTASIQASPEPLPSASATPSRTPSPTPLPGAQNFHQWGSITVFNGLPSDSVRAISQTPDGVMWFGTDNGLARFDGRRVQNFSLGSGDASRVLALETTRSGELWIGTASGAFVYFDGKFETIEKTQGVGITSILPDSDIYLGTNAGFVMRVSRNENGLVAENLNAEPIRDADGSPLGVTAIVETRGRLLAGTAGRGIFIVKNGAASEFSTSPRPLFVNTLGRDEGGSLWIGADAARGISGIYSNEIEAKAERIAAPTARVLALEANDSDIWAGTERAGLFHVAGSKLNKTYTFDNTSGGLRSDTIYTLFTDREGVLWIGTNRGVSRFDRMAPIQETVSESPNGNFIRSLWWNGRALYAGSNRGLFEYGWDETWRKVPGLEERVIYDIGVSDQGIVVGTSTGTYDFRGRPIIGGDTRSIEYFGKATYAAIVGRGVVDISSPRQDVVFPDETASALLAAPGRLWIGTGGNGLFSFDGKIVKLELGPEALNAGTIWNMNWGLDGDIWIAGQHGVFRVADGKAERVVEAEDVRDVYADGPDIWAATTTRGLLHARHDEHFGWLVSSIGFEQGLPSEKAFSIVPFDGLLVGTNRGVVKYRPRKIAPKLIPGRILSQRVHGLEELKFSIDLDYPQNSLLIEVAGQSSRTFPEEFQYAFVLKNARGDELERQVSNDAQYSPSGLAAGEYAIEAYAFDRDLNRSEPLLFRFTVAKAPFPWTAAALGALLVLALAGLVWAFVEHRRMKHRNRELAAARFDLANEAERERRRIARDLHDQTLADLRSLMIASDKLVADNGSFRGEIEAVSTEIRRICEDLSPSVLENVGLVAALEFLLSRTVENRKFSAEESAEERIDFPINVQLQIYRIAQEVLTNIDRHSNADLVEMKVESTPDGELHLTIRDNGKPFHPGASTNGRGISNIRSRANLIGANVGWNQSSDGANIFSLGIGNSNGA